MPQLPSSSRGMWGPCLEQVCVRACVRACARVRVCVCTCACARVRVRVCGWQQVVFCLSLKGAVFSLHVSELPAVPLLSGSGDVLTTWLSPCKQVSFPSLQA